MEPIQKKIQRLTGTVVSDKMEQTIVVLVRRVKTHPIYKKQYNVSKKFKVHDPKKQFHPGDVVTFHPCRPISKEKSWIVEYPS